MNYLLYDTSKQGIRRAIDQNNFLWYAIPHNKVLPRKIASKLNNINLSET